MNIYRPRLMSVNREFFKFSDLRHHSGNLRFSNTETNTRIHVDFLCERVSSESHWPLEVLLLHSSYSGKDQKRRSSKSMYHVWQVSSLVNRGLLTDKPVLGSGRSNLPLPPTSSKPMTRKIRIRRGCKMVTLTFQRTSHATWTSLKRYMKRRRFCRFRKEY